MTELEAAVVECYSGYTYAQEPRAVTWEGRRYVVAEIETRWRAPDGPRFRICTESGNRFELYFHETGDRWTVAKLHDHCSPEPT